MANRKKKLSPSDAANSPVGESEVPRDDRLSEEEIRVRAYELYLERGGVNGHEVEDWLRAEDEVRQRAQGRSREVSDIRA